MTRWLESLGLHRKELRAWASYDWANSAFATTIMGALLPIYYLSVSGTTLPEADRTAYWGYTQAFALLIIALTSPFLGAAADFLGREEKISRGLRGRRRDWVVSALLRYRGQLAVRLGRVRDRQYRLRLRQRLL